MCHGNQTDRLWQSSKMSKIASNINRPSTNPATGQTTLGISTQEGMCKICTNPICSPFISEAIYPQGLSTGVIDIVLESWQNATKPIQLVIFQKTGKIGLQSGTDLILTPTSFVLNFVLEMFNSNGCTINL